MSSTYQTSHTIKDLSSRRIANEEHVSSLHALLNLLLLVLVNHASRRLPCVERRPASILCRCVEPVAVVEQGLAAIGIIAELELVDGDAQNDDQRQAEGQHPAKRNAREWHCCAHCHGSRVYVCVF